MNVRILSLLVFLGIGLSAGAQGVSYRIIHEVDTIVKAKIGGVSLGEREVRHFIYEYPSQNADKEPVTISGVIMVPSDILDGSVPCDGIVMYNHATIGSPAEAPSAGGLGEIGTMLSSPLRPNYIIVACDYIGYGSSIDHPICYLAGDVNAHNALDGLLAARQLMSDRQIPMGRYLFNVGASQGGTESMYVAKVRDMEAKYRDQIRFDKTFAGSGVLDCEKAYEEFVRIDKCDPIHDVAMFLISVNENYHLGIDYKDLFNEPLGSHVGEFLKTKDKSTLADLGVTAMDSLHQLLKPAYMDLDSPEAQVLKGKLAEIKIENGWVPDPTQQYFWLHSRHDNYVPVQSARSLLKWMRGKGFTASLVPGKTNLQTNMMVFKLKHIPSVIVWAIQTLAAIQYWPVIYYEGEQNRYYHEAVHDLNLMKLIHYIEGLGIDLRSIINEAISGTTMASADLAGAGIDPEGSISQLTKAPRSTGFFDFINRLNEILGKVDLDVNAFYEMLDDSGVTVNDLLEVYQYLTSTEAPVRDTDSSLGKNIEAPIYLLRLYEQNLALWFAAAGLDARYDTWGW